MGGGKGGGALKFTYQNLYSICFLGPADELYYALVDWLLEKHVLTGNL